MSIVKKIIKSNEFRELVQQCLWRYCANEKDHFFSVYVFLLIRNTVDV